MNYRKSLGRLLSDLKYIIGIFPGSDPMYADLEVERENIKKHWDSALDQRYPVSQVVDNKNSEIMRVVYGLNYRPMESKPVFIGAPSMTINPISMSFNPASNTPPRGGLQQGQLNNTVTRGVSVDRVLNTSVVQ